MDNYCLALSIAYNIKMAKLIDLDESGYPHIVFTNVDTSPVRCIEFIGTVQSG